MILDDIVEKRKRTITKRKRQYRAAGYERDGIKF